MLVTKILMPRLSLTMKKGEISQWYKKEGEVVNKGEPLVEVITEKITYDVESPTSGVLQKVIITEGNEVPVAEVMGIITAPGEELSSEMNTDKSVRETKEPFEKRVLASPAAKRLAKEHSIDLREIIVTKKGRITEEDVRRFIDKVETKLHVKEVIPLTGIRKSITERISSSARIIPQSTITMEAEMSNALRLHKDLHYSYDAILVGSVAKAIEDFPRINSTLRNDSIIIFDEINIGVAIDTKKGLIVPVVHDADKLSLSNISRTIEELGEKAKAGKLLKEEISSGTFTVSNLGMFGVDTFTPIINPPEAAILGMGRMVEKPVIVDGEISMKTMCYLSLTFDHRIIDGAPAAKFLERVKYFLETINS